VGEELEGSKRFWPLSLDPNPQPRREHCPISRGGGKGVKARAGRFLFFLMGGRLRYEHATTAVALELGLCRDEDVEAALEEPGASRRGSGRRRFRVMHFSFLCRTGWWGAAAFAGGRSFGLGRRWGARSFSQAMRRSGVLITARVRAALPAIRPRFQ